MGLFDWFRRRPTLPVDKLWLTEEAKFQGIALEIASVPVPTAVLLVTHFCDSLAELAKRLKDFEVEVNIAETPSNLTDALSPRSEVPPISVLAMVSNDLPNIAMSLRDSSKMPVESVALVVVEKHPLPTQEQRVLEFTRLLPWKCQLSIHTSLEDPIIRTLTADWIVEQLRQMGVKENQAIESYIVSKQIRAMQLQLEARCPTPKSAPTAQEWLRLNSQPS